MRTTLKQAWLASMLGNSKHWSKIRHGVYGARAVRRARGARAREGFMRHQRPPGNGVVQRGRGQRGGCCAGTERCGRRCAPDAALC